MTTTIKKSSFNEFMPPSRERTKPLLTRISEIRQKLRPSFHQRHQRELAWLMYISKGYEANLAGALLRNCLTMSYEEQGALKKILDRIERSNQELEQLMSRKR